MNRLNEKELRTGAWYGTLYTAYDDEAFRHSVALFAEGFLRNGFDLSRFVGTRCQGAGGGLSKG